MAPFRPKTLLAVDTETTGLRPWHGDRAFAVSMADQDLNTWYTEWPVDPFTRIVTPDENDLRFIRNLLQKNRLPKVFHNRKFDERMLNFWGVELRGPNHDTSIAARICCTNELSYRLKYLSKRYAGIDDEDEKSLSRAVDRARRKGRKEGWLLHESTAADYWTPKAVDPEDGHCEEYARKDAVRTAVLWFLYESLMKGEQCLREFYEFEMGRLYDVAWRMENRGVAVDRERNEESLKTAHSKMELHADKMRKMTGRPELNPGSAKQLIPILYGPQPEGYGLEILGHTDTGDPSTALDELKPHAAHPFVQHLLFWRSGEKADTTFFGKYQSLMVPDPLVKGGWVLHPSINQSNTKTFRLSMSEPNLQQVSNADTAARSFDPVQARTIFKPRPGYVFLSADYSQQEIRIFSWVAQIKEMLDVLYSGGDINTANANLAWGGKNNPHALYAAAESLELGSLKVTNERVIAIWKELGWSYTKASKGLHAKESLVAAESWLRRFNYEIVAAEASIGKKNTRTRAKNLFYLKLYGGGRNAAKDMLYTTAEDAAIMLHRFDTIFPGIKATSDRLSNEAIRNGFVFNLWGRRLNVERRKPYKAINYVVQGTAADEMKEAMVRCDDYIAQTGLDAHLVLTVHDEIVFEVRESHLKKWFLRGIKTIMEDTQGRIGVPMTVEMAICREHWNDKEKVEL